MNLLDLIERGGRISHTKTSYIIGVFVSTWVVIFETLKGTLSPDVFSTYLFVVVVGSLGSKGIEKFSEWKTKKPTIEEDYIKPPRIRED